MNLDKEQLAELKDVLEDEFIVLINTYIKDAEYRLNLIQEGLQTHNYEAIRLAAHSLKGASANLGAQNLAKLCEEVEHNCRVGQTGDLQKIFVEIYQHFQLVKSELLGWC